VENVIKDLTRWEGLDSWITSNEKFFSIAHFNRPAIATAWRLDVSGLIANKKTYWESNGQITRQVRVA
jgi:DMSO/TMAO reductase YedYZ molybdopterin-dependent catalytic subunit